jgi:hypothetical protein
VDDVDSNADCETLALLLSIGGTDWVLVASEVCESAGVKVKKNAVSELWAVASTDGEMEADADDVPVNNSFDDVIVFDATADVDDEPDIVICIVKVLLTDLEAGCEGVANWVILYVNGPDSDGDEEAVRDNWLDFVIVYVTMLERLTLADEDLELVAKEVAHDEWVAEFTFVTDDSTVTVLVAVDNDEVETVDVDKALIDADDDVEAEWVADAQPVELGVVSLENVSILEGDVDCDFVRDDEMDDVPVGDPDCAFIADVLEVSEANKVKLGVFEVLLVTVIIAVTVLIGDNVELADVVGECDRVAVLDGDIIAVSDENTVAVLSIVYEVIELLVPVGEAVGVTVTVFETSGEIVPILEAEEDAVWDGDADIEREVRGE